MPLSEAVEEHSVLVDGNRMMYQRTGHGPALLMIHGLVGSAHNWETNLADLARHATVYAIDLMNMGSSARVAGLDAGLEAESDRLVSFLDAVGLQKTDVVGHSHGGAVAMMLAARHPGRVRRLVLFAPANPFCELGRGLIRFYNTWLGTLFARSIPAMPRLAKRIALHRMYVDRRKVTGTALEGYVGQFNRGSVDRVLNVVRGWWKDMAVLREQLTQVAKTPVLLIWGDRDSAVGLRSGHKLAEALGARLLVVEGVGHLPFAEAPELCNAAIGRWLRQA